MTLRPLLLVLAPREVGSRIAAQAGEGQALALADPYDAILEMGRRPWPAVLLAARPPELAPLARASRRLQKDSRIVALCGPAEEAQVQSLTEEVLDDYLIHPATGAEVAGLLDRSRRAGPPATEALSAAELADLIESARDPATLEARTAALVASRLGGPVQWGDAASDAPEAEGPLLRFDEPPRCLRPRGPLGPPGPDAEAMLASLRQLLPALRTTARRTEVLRRLSKTDDLTGLYNRRYFHHAAGQILAWSQRRGARATLLLYDIDNFKRYNDEFGHPVGDEILRETAAMIRRITRSQDIVARIGGDEFAVLFWEFEPPRAADSRPLQKAIALADRFRRAVADRHFPFLGPQAKGCLTISGGLASFPRDGATIEELLRGADEALASAKRNGKNAIRIVGPE